MCGVYSDVACMLSDIDECQRTSGICGAHSKCNNTIGAYFCTCLVGFNATDPKSPPGQSNACTGTIFLSVSLFLMQPTLFRSYSHTEYTYTVRFILSIGHPSCRGRFMQVAKCVHRLMWVCCHVGLHRYWWMSWRHLRWSRELQQQPRKLCVFLQ